MASMMHSLEAMKLNTFVVLTMGTSLGFELAGVIGVLGMLLGWVLVLAFALIPSALLVFMFRRVSRRAAYANLASLATTVLAASWLVIGHARQTFAPSALQNPCDSCAHEAQLAGAATVVLVMALLGVLMFKEKRLVLASSGAAGIVAYGLLWYLPETMYFGRWHAPAVAIVALLGSYPAHQILKGRKVGKQNPPSMASERG